MNKVERQITGIKIDAEENVEISFSEIVPLPEKGNGTEEEEDDEPGVLTNEYTGKFAPKPHKDFTDAMKNLRKLALDVCEMEVGSVVDYNVSGIKISGDLLKRQSRVVLTVSKYVKRTDKVISWKTPQITMYGESDLIKSSVFRTSELKSVAFISCSPFVSPF